MISFTRSPALSIIGKDSKKQYYLLQRQTFYSADMFEQEKYVIQEWAKYTELLKKTLGVFLHISSLFCTLAGHFSLLPCMSVKKLQSKNQHFTKGNTVLKLMHCPDRSILSSGIHKTGKRKPLKRNQTESTQKAKQGNTEKAEQWSRNRN